jgi:hypothetical protein
VTKESDLSPWDLLFLFHEVRPWPLIAINRATHDIKAADFVMSETCAQEAQGWAEQWNAAGSEIYFSVNPLKEPLGRKASKQDVLEARWMWVDCDPPDTLAEPELEAWRADKLADLRDFKNCAPPPTLIVDSGRGIWAFWRLRNPEPVDGVGLQTARVESFGRGLERAFDADACHNIDRIARLPGFVNHKTGATARVLEFHPERAYDLGELPRAPLCQSAGADKIADGLRELIDDGAARVAVTNYLVNEAPLAIEGQNGRMTTMRVLQKCQDLGCSFEASVELMEERWNDRCSPPWELGEIAYALRRLRRNDPIGCEHPAALERRRADYAAKWREPIDAEPAKDGRTATSERYPLKYHGDPDDAPLKRWLLVKILPQKGLALLSGQSGTYKTFLAFDLAVAVMSKESFAGHPMKRQGGVLFIAAESQDEVRPRLQGVARAKLVTAADRASDDRRLLDTARLPFVWSEQCPRLAADGDGAFKELREIVRKAADGLLARTGFPLALIVIDTLMAAADFKDANDRAEAQKVMNALRRIANEFDVLVLVVDHFGKDESKGTAGASSKEAAADTVLAALGTKSLSGKVTNTRLALRKVRGAKQGEEIPYWTRSVPLGNDAEGEIINTLAVVWGNASGAGKPDANRPAWPGKLRIFGTALESCLRTSGAMVRADPGGGEVRVVDRVAVRKEFLQNYPADKYEARRKAFDRNSKDALAEGLIASREIDFDGVIRSVFWIPGAKSDGAETGSEESGTEAGRDT